MRESAPASVACTPLLTASQDTEDAPDCWELLRLLPYALPSKGSDPGHRCAALQLHTCVYFMRTCQALLAGGLQVGHLPAPVDPPNTKLKSAHLPHAARRPLADRPSACPRCLPPPPAAAAPPGCAETARPPPPTAAASGWHLHMHTYTHVRTQGLSLLTIKGVLGYVAAVRVGALLWLLPCSLLLLCVV